MGRASLLLDQQREIYSSGAVVRGIASRGFCRNSNLNVDIAFESLDPDGCDHVILPDRKNAAIPYGYDRLARNIEAAYPGQGVRVQALKQIR